VRAQSVGLSDAVDPDHAGEATGPPRHHPGQRVLEHRGPVRRDAERTRPGQEGVRSGLALQMVALGADAVDAIREAQDRRRADLAAWEQVSRDTARD
jgi:hypothetical protein